MIAPLPSAIAYGMIGVLVVWRLYVRFQRLTGRQRLSKYRGPVTVLVLTVLVAALAFASQGRPLYLQLLASALAAGAALGAFGLRQTRFDAVPGEGLFYTPDSRLGIALFLVFFVRIAYRLAEVTFLAPGGPGNAAEFARSPLTLLAFGFLAGYNLSYAIGLLRWRARVFRAKAQRATRSVPVQAD